jgi:hypothetical protein
MWLNGRGAFEKYEGLDGGVGVEIRTQHEVRTKGAQGSPLELTAVAQGPKNSRQKNSILVLGLAPAGLTGCAGEWAATAECRFKSHKRCCNFRRVVGLGFARRLSKSAIIGNG